MYSKAEPQYVDLPRLDGRLTVRKTSAAMILCTKHRRISPVPRLCVSRSHRSHQCIPERRGPRHIQVRDDSDWEAPTALFVRHPFICPQPCSEGRVHRTMLSTAYLRLHTGSWPSNDCSRDRISQRLRARC